MTAIQFNIDRSLFSIVSKMALVKQLRILNLKIDGG